MTKQRKLWTLAICTLTSLTLPGLALARPPRGATRHPAYHSAPRHRAPPRYHARPRHYYPPIGHRVRALPRARLSFTIGGFPHYYHAGLFYRPSRYGFVVVAAPIGAVLPVLPPSYTTVYVSGRPYYYADATYYVWDQSQRGYVVVAQPEGVDAELAVESELYIYPRNGQSEGQQAEDRYQCHRWGVKETGFDPSDPPSSPNPQARSDYQRAVTACLEGRGYTVK